MHDLNAYNLILGHTSVCVLYAITATHTSIQSRFVMAVYGQLLLPLLTYLKLTHAV